MRMGSEGGRRGLRRVSLALAVLLLTLTQARAATPRFPQLTGRVVDEAGILNAATRVELDRELAAQETASGDQVVVVTLKSLQGFAIEDFGYQLGRHWGIGQKGRNNGVLLIVAPAERKVRIEIGYGLEGALTDAASRTIIERDIMPAFRRGDFNAGVLAGIASILNVMGGDTSARTDAGLKWDTQPASGSKDPMLWLAIALMAVWALGLAMIFVFGARYRPERKAYLMYRTQRSKRGLFGDGLLPRAIYYGGHGSGGGGFGGGGGFSGGGGSFGGGGASGSW